MQVDVGQQRRHDASLRSPLVRVRDRPVFEYPRVEPFPDQLQQHPIAYPLLEKFPQMSMIQRFEKLPDVHLQDPTAADPHRLLPHGVQRLMCRPLGAKAVGTGQKVLFVDGFEHHDDRPLKDLVFKRRDPDGARVATRPFRNMHPPHRWCPVRAGLGAVEQRLEVLSQIRRIVLDRLSVHARGPVRANAQVRFVEPTQVDVVGQGSESHRRRLLR